MPNRRRPTPAEVRAACDDHAWVATVVHGWTEPFEAEPFFAGRLVNGLLYANLAVQDLIRALVDATDRIADLKDREDATPEMRAALDGALRVVAEAVIGAEYPDVPVPELPPSEEMN